eukprot:Polyplicarium_translucidae@DN2179_c0_g1_i6.p1
MVQDVVVRVFSKSGRTRVTISNGATLMELKRIVASHLNTDGDLQLSDGKNRIFTGDRKTLASLGITSGDVLHAESSSERSPEIAPVQLEHRGTRTVEPTNVPSRSSRDVPSAAEPTTGVSSEANLCRTLSWSQTWEWRCGETEFWLRRWTLGTQDCGSRRQAKFSPRYSKEERRRPSLTQTG